MGEKGGAGRVAPGQLGSRHHRAQVYQPWAPAETAQPPPSSLKQVRSVSCVPCSVEAAKTQKSTDIAH